MAVTLNNFWGAETGGMEEATSFTGASADSGTVKTGAYSYLFNAAAESISFNPFEFIASAGVQTVIGFWFRTPASFGATVNPNMQLGDGVFIDFRLELNSTGQLILLDSTLATVITGPVLDANVWYFVELAVIRAASSSGSLFIDGIRAGNVINADFDAITGTPVLSFNSVSTTIAWSVDNIYFLSNATTANLLYGCEIYSYRSNLNSVTPDTGSNLNAGTWLGAQAVPFSDAAVATYSSSAVNGSVLTNDVGGSAGTGGPSTDANITGTIKACKGMWRALRGGGGATTHSGYVGNSVDGVTAFTLALTTAYAFYARVSESATICPLPSEVGKIGFGTGGAQDITVADMLYTVLHVPPRRATFKTPYMQKKNIRHLIMR